MVISRFLAGMAAAVSLAGCSFDLDTKHDALKQSAFLVGDEPYAVRAAASVMAQGGNAADGAAAMYFALSVTYPVSAGLGGGGICLVHDPSSGRNEEFDFLARSTVSGGAFAVPGNVRGIALMQTSYGAFRGNAWCRRRKGWHRPAFRFPMRSPTGSPRRWMSSVSMRVSRRSSSMNPVGEGGRQHRFQPRSRRNAGCHPNRGRRRALFGRDRPTHRGLCHGAGRRDPGGRTGVLRGSARCCARPPSGRRNRRPAGARNGSGRLRGNAVRRYRAGASHGHRRRQHRYPRSSKG